MKELDTGQNLATGQRETARDGPVLAVEPKQRDILLALPELSGVARSVGPQHPRNRRPGGEPTGNQ